MLNRSSLPQGFGFVLTCLALFAVSACSERITSAPARLNADPDGKPDAALAQMQCVAKVSASSVKCGALAATGADGVSREIIGGQNSYVRLTSDNVVRDAGAETFSFDVTVQNLLNETIGSPGVANSGSTPVPDPDGIRVFFEQAPVVTVGSGIIDVVNEDGTASFTSSNQDFYKYDEVLASNQISAPKPWVFAVPNTVDEFGFTVYVETDVQRNLVINEVLANPGGTISDANGEWFELYNAGTLRVELQNLVIADSAASGRRPYHLVSQSLVVMPGAYVVLGNTSNVLNNGGVPVDYTYGAALALANSLDAIKISRVVGTDTLTIDRVQFASASVSAQNGISRELTNPALDNSNMDGSNWADALVTAVYGPGGRGTPKAQNSTFAP